MNQAFREATTSTAFHLALSRRMIDMLCLINEHRVMDFVSYSHWLNTTRALRAKGLVECHGYELTEAGRLVVNLLREAGLYSTSEDENTIVAEGGL